MQLNQLANRLCHPALVMLAVTLPLEVMAQVTPVLPQDARIAAIPVPENDPSQALTLDGCFDNMTLMPMSTTSLQTSISRTIAPGLYQTCTDDNVPTQVQVAEGHTVDFTHRGIMLVLAAQSMTSRVEFHFIRGVLVDGPAQAPLTTGNLNWDRPMFVGFHLIGGQLYELYAQANFLNEP